MQSSKWSTFAGSADGRILHFRWPPRCVLLGKNGSLDRREHRERREILENFCELSVLCGKSLSTTYDNTQEGDYLISKCLEYVVIHLSAEDTLEVEENQASLV